MGQAGSHAPPPQRGRRALTLPHDPNKLAPKVLPPLCESPRLRSTDNGAILHSGGTISGRRPTTGHDRVPHGHVHSNVFRSRSTGTSSDEARARERDPLHRSHTNLDMRHSDSSNSAGKRFGSEPDLRIEEEEQKGKACNRHFRKKYKAPPPPTHDNFDGSSPDSSEGNARPEPQRKLRLFKTRNETKKLNDQEILHFRSSYHEYKSLDLNDNQFERRYRSPCKDKEKHFIYPDQNDMVQSSSSLKREERLLQTKDYKKTRIERMSGCRAKTTKNEHSEAWKTPLLNRDFRYSERFKKEDCELPPLRREKTFDVTLMASEKENDSSRIAHENRMTVIGEQLKINKLSPLAETSKPLRKSLPSLLSKNNEEKDEFQAELKKATSKIRNQIGSKINNSETKTSQDNTNEQKIPTKIPSKVKQSSLSTIANTEPKVIAGRRPLSRTNEDKTRQTTVNSNPKILDHKLKFNSKENGRRLPDRGQASGKESTPEHSPSRKLDSLVSQASQEKQKHQPPSKQFYFGMIESKQADNNKHLKDFPGLGSPIIEEISNFHLIEQKLLNYQEKEDEDAEFEKFNAKMKKVKNISSESALSSDGSEGSWSAGSLGIALRLRPTLPKKQRTVPRFSPAAAWKQLAALDDHLAAETQPLAVETKMSGHISAESSPRSDQSADKSGDSGISGDNVHSDHRIDSPRHLVQDSGPAAWTPQQDLGDSSSEGAGIGLTLHSSHPSGNVATYSPAAQPFSLSLPRDGQERGKQIQQGFNSLQKLRKSVSGALGAALGSRRFDVEHEPMLQEQEQNWFLTKSAPNSLSNPLIFQQPRAKGSDEDVIKEEEAQFGDKGEPCLWRRGTSYLSWGGHVMYLPPAADQPLSMIATVERPVRSKSSGCLEVSARSARARAALGGEMRERERSASPIASPSLARALPATVLPSTGRSSSTNLTGGSRSKRFTFQSTVRQLERRKIAEKLSKEADLKEQQRRTELEAMRRVEEEFQRKRAREKASIRQQLRLVSSGATSMPTASAHHKARDDPDGSCRASPAPERVRENRQRHSNASSDISGRSKSTTPIRSVELSEWHSAAAGARVYRDWAPAHAHDHPPACARMPIASHNIYNGVGVGVGVGGGGGGEGSAFSGSPRSDNYRLEFARGRSSASPRTPRAPRLLAARAPSSSGSDLSLRQPIKISEPAAEEAERVIVPTVRAAPAPAAHLAHLARRAALLTH